MTEAAEADLAEIWANLAISASDKIASRFVETIEAAFEPPRHFPLSGASRDRLANGLRVAFRNPYAIYYMPQPDAVIIVRVIHGARDVAVIADRGGFF